MEEASKMPLDVEKWVYPQGVENPRGILHSITECVVGFITSGLEITETLGEALTRALSEHGFGPAEALTHQRLKVEANSSSLDMKTHEPEFDGYRFSMFENGVTASWQLIFRYNGNRDQHSSQITLHSFQYPDWEKFYEKAHALFQTILKVLPECLASSYLLNYVSAFKIDAQAGTSQREKTFSDILNAQSNWLPAELSKVNRFDLPLSVSSHFPQSELNGQKSINYQQLDFRYFVQQRLLRIQHQTQVLPNAEMQAIPMNELYRDAFLESSRSSMIAHAHEKNKQVMGDLLHDDVCKLVGLKYQG